MSTIMTFNSVTSTTMGFTILKVFRPAPEEKENTIDIPERPGLISSNFKYSKKIIPVEAILIGSSYSDLVTKQRALPGYLKFSTDKVLSFDDVSGIYYNARLSSKLEPKSQVYRFAYYDLIFTCNDPFAYATNADTDTHEVVADNTSYTITNSGDDIAYPTITFFFNQVQSHIYISNSAIENNRMDISKSFVMSDELVIDCKNLTIKLNGANSPAGLGVGGSELAEFIMFAIGDNTITVGTDDATINCDVTTTFNKPYLF